MNGPDQIPLTKGHQAITWNFKLLANDLLGGFGGLGEGMSVQIAPDGRRIIWLAHESAPKNFTAVDVSDPRKPKVVCQTDLPHANMRSNSLETTGNIMAVAYQTTNKGMQPAGFELFPSRNRPNRFPSSTAPGRIRAACISCGSATANMSIARRDLAISFRPIRTTISSTAASTCAIRRSR
jgi:hypothetical protein